MSHCLNRTLPLLLSLTLLQSCAPDEYATELSSLLSNYAQQISRRLAEEEKRYLREARILQNADDRAQNRTADEAIAMAAAGLAADIVAGRATGDRAISGATAFGQTEYDRARLLAARDQDAELQRIRTLQSLQVDSVKIEALRAALEVLAKKPDWQSALAESAQFGKDTKNHLDLLSCQDLDASVKEFTAQDAALAAAIAATAATETAKKAELMKRQVAVRASLAAATGGRASTGHFDAATEACK